MEALKEIAEVRSDIKELSKLIKNEHELLNLYMNAHNSRLKRIEKRQMIQGISICVLFIIALYTLLNS